MPDFSAQLRLPEETERPPADSLVRRFGLPTAAAILLHAAVLGPLVWWTPSPPDAPVPMGIEVSPVEAAAPSDESTPTEVTEETQTAQPEAAPAPPPPAPVERPPPPTTPPPPPPPRPAPPPAPEPLRPPPPDEAPPPPPDATPPQPPEVTPEPPPDLPPPEQVAPTPLLAPLAAEPLEAEETVPPPPPEDAVETPPPPPPPTPDAPEETVRAIAPPPPRQPPPRPAAPRPAPPREAPAVAAAPAPAVAAPPAPARPPASYVGRLMAALERHKDYPMAARMRRAEGTVVLRFAMRRDGAVASWRIERSSGHEDLDQAVAAMIRRASPLPAPPPELPGDPVELVVPVRFTLR